MKIIRLEVEDFQRIEVVAINANGEAVEISGKNEQGKSSILDFVEAMLGGGGHQPVEPIRRGTEGARGVLELDDLIIERVWTKKTDRLVVKNKDGASYPKPQSVLSRIVGPLAFDPVKFMDMRPADQRETLLRVIGVDLDEIEARRQSAYDTRREAGRELRSARARLDGSPEPADGTPDDEVSFDDLRTEMDAAMAEKAKNDEVRHGAERAVSLARAAEEEAANREADVVDIKEQIKAMELRLSEAEDAALSSAEESKKAQAVAKTRLKAAEKLKDPGIGEIQAKFGEVEATNVEVRKAKARKTMEMETDIHQGAVDRAQAAEGLSKWLGREATRKGADDE